jgi:hypothetical protein
MLAAERLLHVWEQAQHCGAVQRSLELLAHALPDHDRASLAGIDLAQRDWHLLRLRRRWFGGALAGCADCPACGERMEVDIDAVAIEGEYPDDAPWFVAADGQRFRMPTLGDLIAVAGGTDADAAARQLLVRCSLDGATVDLATRFDEVDAGLAAIAAERGFALALACTACGTPSRHQFDPTAFLWAELSTAAAQLIDDVDALARAYGWAEHDILAMSAARRRAYLSRIES